MSAYEHGATDDLTTMIATTRRIAAREFTGTSPDERVLVRVTGEGAVIAVRLVDDVLQRYDNAALAELVTRTIRATQRRARAAVDETVAEVYGSLRQAAEADAAEIAQLAGRPNHGPA
jgi:DNA-binding protein YbaB